MSKINIVVAAQTGGAIKGLNDVTAATKRTGAAVRKAQVGMSRFSGEVSKGQLITRKFAMGGLQQAGYQIGDYAVQVANGTSKMQAFGQQAPQLLQIFGPLGAVAGAAVAIFAAFGVAVQKAGKAAKEVETPVRSLSAALSSLEGDAELTGAAFDEYLTKTFGEAEKQIKSMVERLEAIKVTALSDSIGELLKDSSGPLTDMRKRFDDVTRGIIDNQAEIKRLGETASGGARMALQGALEDARDFKDEFGLTTNEFQIFLDNLEKVKGAKTFDDLIASIASMEEHLGQVSGGPIEEFRNGLTNLLDAEGIFERLAAGGQAVQREIDAASDSAQTLGSTVLSVAEATYMLNQGILPPQARNDLVEMDTLYDNIRKRIKSASNESIVLGKTTLSAVEAQYMLNRGILPDGAREDFKQIDTAYQNIRASIEAAEKSSSRSSVRSTAGIKETTKAINTELSPAMKRLQDIQESVGQSFENAMMSAVDGTKSVKDAFKSMASEIIKELYRVFVVKRITGFITNAIGAAFGPAPQGPTPSGAPVGRFDTLTFAGGGYTGNGARAGGLDGKGGYMAMIHPRETVIDHAKGQSMGGVTVIQNNTFGSGVTRAEVNAMLPKMVEATKAAVADAKLRGGSYGGAFA
jgi:hypothetical protein